VRNVAAAAKKREAKEGKDIQSHDIKRKRGRAKSCRQGYDTLWMLKWHRLSF